MFIALRTAVVFHLKVADETKSLSFLSFFSHNSMTTSWLDPRTQGKEIVSKTELWVYMCACVCELGSSPLFAPKHTFTLSAVFTQRLITNLPGAISLSLMPSSYPLYPLPFKPYPRSPRLSPLAFSSHLSFPLCYLSLNVRSLRFEKVVSAITFELSDLQKSLCLLLYTYV